MRSCWVVRHLCLPLLILLLVHIWSMCQYGLQAATVPSLYNHNNNNRSPYSQRVFDQATLPLPQFSNAFKGAIGDVRTNLKTHADRFDGKWS